MFSAINVKNYKFFISVTTHLRFFFFIWQFFFLFELNCSNLEKFIFFPFIKNRIKACLSSLNLNVMFIDVFYDITRKFICVTDHCFLS